MKNIARPIESTCDVLFEESSRLAGWNPHLYSSLDGIKGWIHPLAVLRSFCLMLAIISFATDLQAQRGRGARGGGAIIEREPLAKSESEKRILAVLDDMDKNQRSGSMSVPKVDGRLLRLLTETTNAKNVIEIGTSIGYSGIWFCLALEKTGGHLTTYDIDEGRAAKARVNFKRAGVEDRVTLVLGDAHDEIANLKEPIDILFIDADKEGYLDYLNKLPPLVAPGGLIIPHNMNNRQSDPKFVEAITTNPDLETLFLNKELTCIGVTLKKR